MAYLTRDDIPFHYALADAFTVCDAYHCSLIGGTDPNRYYMWTGWTGNDGKGGGPVLDNSEAGYSWTTYPERLEQAGVSWKIYQDIGDGLDAAGGWGWISDAYRGNYGDNSLLYFDQYRNAEPGDALYDKARTGTNAKAGDGFFDVLRADVKAGKLPQVSWIAAPEAFSEHPNWPANYGAWYVSQVLDALTADPEVWSRTALFITYDENDGYFDHVVPPFAAARRPGRLHRRHRARTLRGQRHLHGRSLRPRPARADARRLPVEHRRLRLLRDLRPHLDHPVHGAPLRRPRAEHLALAARRVRRPDLGLRLRPPARRPGPAARHRRLPARRTTTGTTATCRCRPPTRRCPSRSGARGPPARCRYAPLVDAAVTAADRPGRAHLRRRRVRRRLLPRHLRRTAPTARGRTPPRRARRSPAAWDTAGTQGAYDLTVHGPNGFLRSFQGSAHAAGPEVTARHKAATGQVELTLANPGGNDVRLTVRNAYDGRHRTLVVRSGRRETYSRRPRAQRALVRPDGGRRPRPRVPAAVRRTRRDRPDRRQRPGDHHRLTGGPGGGAVNRGAAPRRSGPAARPCAGRSAG